MSAMDIRDAVRKHGWMGLAMAWKELLYLAGRGFVRLSGSTLHVSERGRFMMMQAMCWFFGAVGEIRDACRAVSAHTAPGGDSTS